jgi:hypothetical protein
MTARNVLPIVLFMSALFVGTGATAAEHAAAIFRVSANGPSRDDALKDAAQTISQKCATGGYVILNNWIRQSADGLFYYGPVAAYCTT